MPLKNNTSYSAVIVDDEPLARDTLRRYLSGEVEMEIVGEAENGHEAVKLIRQQEPDLVFLDIRMPEMSGFEVIEALGTENLPHIVFVTAFDEYALRAFEMHALDYLLKPFNQKRFQNTLEHAKARIQMTEGIRFREEIHQILKELQEKPKYRQRFAARDGGRTIFVNASDVLWIEASEKYIRLHTENRSYLMRESISACEQTLDSERFIRIHRSKIVQLQFIAEIQPWAKGVYLIILKNGKQLTSGRHYRAGLQTLCRNGY